jgi:formiminotetrahydrofolate cyclodeaminase
MNFFRVMIQKNATNNFCQLAYAKTSCIVRTGGSNSSLSSSAACALAEAFGTALPMTYG